MTEYGVEGQEAGDARGGGWAAGMGPGAWRHGVGGAVLLFGRESHP